MSSAWKDVTDTYPAVYRILKENEPLSVPEVIQELESDSDLNIELREAPNKKTVKKALKTLVREGHVTHDSGVDDGGYVRWRTTTRPDLNPKPDGRDMTEEELNHSSV